jgi:hypothetical protein
LYFERTSFVFGCIALSVIHAYVAEWTLRPSLKALLAPHEWVWNKPIEDGFTYFFFLLPLELISLLLSVAAILTPLFVIIVLAKFFAIIQGRIFAAFWQLPLYIWLLVFFVGWLVWSYFRSFDMSVDTHPLADLVSNKYAVAFYGSISALLAAASAHWTIRRNIRMSTNGTRLRI